LVSASRQSLEKERNELGYAFLDITVAFVLDDLS